MKQFEHHYQAFMEEGYVRLFRADGACVSQASLCKVTTNDSVEYVSLWGYAHGSIDIRRCYIPRSDIRKMNDLMGVEL